jgi:hypothetical protein
VSDVVLGRRKRDRLRSFDEAAAYARCHGERDDNVRIVKLPPRRARFRRPNTTSDTYQMDTRNGSRVAGRERSLRKLRPR